MENKNIYFKNPVLSLAEQKVALEIQYPESNVIIKDGTLQWDGVIRPTALSKDYSIKLLYKLGRIPRAWLVSVDLAEEVMKKVPHKFGHSIKDKTIELCLFRNSYKEWTKYDLIAEKIIPWIVEWLYFYEIWQVTGEWKGGGEHPKNHDFRKFIKE